MNFNTLSTTHGHLRTIKLYGLESSNKDESELAATDMVQNITFEC